MKFIKAWYQGEEGPRAPLHVIISTCFFQIEGQETRETKKQFERINFRIGHR